MEKSNVISLMGASKENFFRKNAESEYTSTIISLQGMIVEMYATGENVEDLRANLHTARETFPYAIDHENIRNLEALVEYKERENKPAKLAA